MRDAMFFPNRILYREELLSTTVTYAVDLSETEFWNLKPIMPIEQLGIRPAEFRLNEVATKSWDAMRFMNSTLWLPSMLIERGFSIL